MKLYHSVDTRSLRCVWLLEELGMSYDLDVVPFPPRVKAPEFLAVNPLGTLPYLVDGDTKMSESVAILEYLLNRYDGGELRLTPDEADYGSWLNWMHFGEASLANIQATILRYTLFLPKPQRLPVVGEDLSVFLQERLKMLDAGLQGKTYLCGERFTAADISVGYALLLSSLFGYQKYFTPAITAYFDRLQSRSAYQAARAKS